MGAPPPDTEPPSAPGTLTRDRRSSSSQIELSWQPATDNGAVTLYRIERCEGAGCSDFNEIAMTTSTSHIRTPPSRRRPTTPTACAPRTLSPTSGLLEHGERDDA